MEINQGYLEKFQVGKSEKARRDLIIKDIAAMTGMTEMVIYWKTARPIRLPTDWLENWYQKSQQEFTEVGKRVKFWKLLKESKVEALTKNN